MPTPLYVPACCLLMAAPALAGDYPPPPGPYTNPAIQQWLAARTEPLLTSARRERRTTAETPVSGGAPGEPEISTRLISARADQWPAPRSWNGPTANEREDKESPVSEPLAEPVTSAGSAGLGEYAGQPLRWRNPVADPVDRAGTAPKQIGPTPRRGLLDPLPAEPAVLGWVAADLRGPEFTAAKAAAGHRSTSELLARYLDYDPETMNVDADHYGQAKSITPEVRNRARAPEPESRRYYYRPTGTTFQFRALETPPRQLQQARNSDAGDWHAPKRINGAW